MAWNPDITDRITVIEVYPAATLLCYGIQNSAYKEKGQKKERVAICNGLSKLMNIQCDSQKMILSAYVLDSAVCMLASKDFLNGDVYFPYDFEKAIKEGWIWVKKKCFDF